MIIAAVAAVPLAYLNLLGGPSRARGSAPGNPPHRGSQLRGLHLAHARGERGDLVGLRGSEVRGTWLVLVVLAAILIMAYASWHLVEKHALCLKRYTSRKSTTPGEPLAR